MGTGSLIAVTALREPAAPRTRAVARTRAAPPTPAAGAVSTGRVGSRLGLRLAERRAEGGFDAGAAEVLGDDFAVGADQPHRGNPANAVARGDVGFRPVAEEPLDPFQL